MNPTDVKFCLGQIVATANARECLSDEDMACALARHQSGDWGDITEHDRKENEFSLTHELRLLSVYHGAAGVKFYIITEADRSVTTILLPEGY